MRTDPHPRLVRALTSRGGGVAPVAASSRPWASITFTGARHDLTFDLPPDAAERMAAGLDEGALAIPGHLVADIAVVARTPCPQGVRLRIEAWTLEAG